MKYISIIFVSKLPKLRTSNVDRLKKKKKENGFMFKRAKSRRYPSQTITIYADGVALLANSNTQAESLLHNLEKAGRSIVLYVNTNKTRFICFK